MQFFSDGSLSKLLKFAGRVLPDLVPGPLLHPPPRTFFWGGAAIPPAAVSKLCPEHPTQVGKNRTKATVLGLSAVACCSLVMSALRSGDTIKSPLLYQLSYAPGYICRARHGISSPAPGDARPTSSQLYLI